MPTPSIPRHKTAIRRGDLSRPVKLALRDGVIERSGTVFDFGCGHGEDLALLTAEGVSCTGWDPNFRPDAERVTADVVNLGYVINVVEDPEERANTVRAAWELCRQTLVVAAQVLMYGRGETRVEFGDGVLTGRGTFQKFFEQGELKTYLETLLGVEAVPAGIGVFYLFRDDEKRQQHLANRYRRHMPVRRRAADDPRLAANRELLDSLIDAARELGRPPEDFEFKRYREVVEVFGSVKRAFSLAQKLTGHEEWEELARGRREDLLVFLALSRFRTRPILSGYPRTLQRDLKHFFGTYTEACRQADELLFKAGDAAAVDEACKRSKIGKLLPDDLYVHRDALERLEPLLRIYEGCGRAYLGEVEGANLIKIHRRTGKLSYLVYPEFDDDPHPALLRCVKLNLRTRQLECYEYGESKNPPVLHRKETFLHPDDERYAKFARLTAQEEKQELLSDFTGIGTRDGWARRLAEKGFTLRGHKLVKAKATKETPPAPEAGAELS
jgi:DNA phosphorothioation-associated putative methyltransferase